MLATVQRKQNVWFGVPVRAPGLSVLNTCALSIHKCAISNVWPLMSDNCVNIWKYINVIGFTGDIFDSVLGPLTYLHKWCQVVIGLGNGLASVRCQATPPEPMPNYCQWDPGKKVRDSWFNTWGRGKMATISQTTFSNAIKVAKFRIFQWFLFLRV